MRISRLICVACSPSTGVDISHIFFFNDTPSTKIYTLSLHDALPISWWAPASCRRWSTRCAAPRDRKSTRLNSSHVRISYAVFCLKKKTTNDSVLPCRVDCVDVAYYDSLVRLVLV